MILYLFSIFSQAYNIVIDTILTVTGYFREVVGGLNTTGKRFLFQLISTVQLPGYQEYDKHIAMNYATHKYGISFAREFQKHLSNA